MSLMSSVPPLSQSSSHPMAHCHLFKPAWLQGVSTPTIEKCAEQIFRYIKKIESASKTPRPMTKALVKYLMENLDQAKVVRGATESSVYRLFRERTPLGTVLAKIEASQESPDIALPSSETAKAADQEAAHLLRSLPSSCKLENGQRVRVTSAEARGVRMEIDGKEIYISSPGSISPKVAPMPGGKFIVTWATQLRGWAQIFRADGSEETSSFPISATATRVESDPQAMALSDGQVVFAWIRSGHVFVRYLSLVENSADDELQMNGNGVASNLFLLPDRDDAYRLVWNEGEETLTSRVTRDPDLGGPQFGPIETL